MTKARELAELGDVVTVDSGNVGIGTTSPNTGLSVVTGSANGIELGQDSDASTDSARLFFSTSAGSNAIHSSSGAMRFFTGSTAGSSSGTEAARIDSSGNVLVGQTTKRGKVTLSYNTNTVSDPTVYVANDGGSAALITFGDGGGSNTYGSITKGSGNTVGYNEASDYRLKENVVELTGATDRLKQLEPKRFNFIADEDDTTVDGFLAHEVQTVVPQAITGEKDAVDDEGEPVYQGIDQSKLVPLLTAALQEAVAKIETLETKVAALEAE